MKLETLVNFPTTGLDMTPFLAPRSSGCVHSRPSSATPLSTSYKTQRAPAKSVHFEDEVGEVPKSPLGRSVSTGRGKGKRFTFPWKRQQSMPTDKRSRSDKQSDKKHSEGSSKKSAAYSRSRSLDRGQRRSRSPESSRRAYSPPAGSESPMSVRSAPSTVDRQQLQQPHHRYFLPLSPPNNLNGSRTSLDESRLNNVYDLFAVCNHTGTLSRGHYTAYCKNPADGRWYNFDDTTVQPITEDQLVTDKAYMLFYVRQSLMSSSPLSSSESSQSSSNSASHWIYHMPPFRLDLNDYHDELCHQQQQMQQSHRQSQLSQTNSENHFTTGDVRPRTRLSSSNSVVSAPATMAISSRVSPPVSAQDVESFPSPGSGSVVPNYHYSSQDTHSDAFSAVSLPPYRGRGISAAPTYNQAVAYSGRGAHGTRHHSLRLGKGRENRGEWIEERGWGREGNTRVPQRSHTVVRSQDNVHKLNSQTTFEAYNGLPSQRMRANVAPTRSIPSLPTHEEIVMTSNRYSQEPPHSFMTPQLQQSAVSNGHIPIHITPPRPILTHSHPESCV